LKKPLIFSSFLVRLPRNYKKLIQFIFDFLALSSVYIFSVSLVDGIPVAKSILLFGFPYVFVSLIGLNLSGIYKAVIRYSGARLLEMIAMVQLITTSFLGFSVLAFDSDISLVSLLLLFLLTVFILAGARLLVREIIYFSRPIGRGLLIYGAGQSGLQLLASVRQDADYDVVGFIDDDERKQGSQVHGIKVFPPSKLNEIVLNREVSMVALAIPNASREELRIIIESLTPLPLVVKTVNTVDNILRGKNSYENLEEIRFEELLGRDRVSPYKDLLVGNICGKVVLVTGAGGSIGSELCRQIIANSPKKLILFEQSEIALYNIQQELQSEWGHLIIPVLASVTDLKLMQALMKRENVQSVYHAAAYKHVPLVESNPFQAIHNNVFGTRMVLGACVFAGVSSFTLISTDKAVRPTNIMGASKRIAEIICQLSNVSDGDKIRIAMVRFGNVIGSSGSAIPKFRAQIKSGGPVTVTHPEITRYFMVIPEAVELVLQASSMATGGEVFVLDMGEPIKIIDLVGKLIRFSGNLPASVESPQQEHIAVKYTGLRPGEKLYEELLISGNDEDTAHPKIRKIREAHPNKSAFDDFLNQLNVVCETENEDGLRELLSSEFIGYTAPEESKIKAGELSDSLVIDNSVVISGVDDCQMNSTTNCNLEENSDEVFAKNSELRFEAGIEKYRFGKRLFLSFLHRYFLIRRPLTLGVRCAMINDQREVLLLKHTYISGWHMPGGGVDVGESTENAVCREVSEETMFDLLGPPKLVDIYHYNQITKRDHVVVFLSRDFKKNRSNISSVEIESCRFFPLDSLPVDIDRSAKRWILDALKLDESCSI
jgi:FlaA1/EpsC-like NDP-sugar epimerase/8-oxo-dGTP pyrophosphatase MutT (NUDIX family)